MKLRLSENLSLPIEAVTEKLAFLGRTGSGKTYAAMKLAELMLEAGAQIVSLDPVGAWHGLRIGGPWSVYIFGGAARILRVLASHYPKALLKEQIGEAADLSHSSGSFNTYLSKLRTLELIEGRGALKASDILFE